MAEFFTELNEKHIAFIAKQKIFFVSTATTESHINLSPKGMDTFLVVSKNKVAYLDLTGSGNETAAHLHHNSRMTMMMCSFDKQPLIFRLYGKGNVVNQYDRQWQSWEERFKKFPGTRQIFILEIHKVQTSCGYGVPIADNMKERETLRKWSENKGETGVKQYWKDKNITSIDGLPTHILNSREKS